MKNKSYEFISSLLMDNQLITNAKQISNHFDNSFTSTSKKINRNIVKEKKAHPSDQKDHQKNKSTKVSFSGQKTEPKRCTKYLGVIIDEHLSFNDYMNTLEQKCNRANDSTAKLKYYVTADVLKTILYGNLPFQSTDYLIFLKIISNHIGRYI